MLSLRYDVDNTLVATSFVEFYSTVNQSIESIIFADTHILAWVVLCTTLTYDNVSCDTLLTAPDLNT